MKTLSFALLLMAGMAVVLLGCSDNSNPAMTAGAQLGQQPAITSLSKGGNINSATGTIHVKYTPVTGQTNSRSSFTAIRHSDGTCSGEFQNRDDGPIFYGHGKVYDLKVSGNMAKIAFRYTKGNIADYYGADVKITDIVAWFVVIDNGEGANATGPDLVTMILFTDGSDIFDATIEGIDNMGPQEYLDYMRDYLLPLYGVPYEMFIGPLEHGSVQVK